MSLQTARNDGHNCAMIFPQSLAETAPLKLPGMGC
jgi:hypothetical protein